MLRQQNDLKERMRRGPIQLRMAGETEAKFESQLESAKARHRESQLAAKNKEISLGEREAKITDMQGKLNACDSNKEFQLLKDRIAADEQANSVLSDEILELFEKIDVQHAEVVSETENLNRAKAETAKLKTKIEGEQQMLTDELARVSNDLVAAEKQLPKEISDQYHRIIGSRGEDALAETDTETCGNCNMTITAQTVNDLLNKKPVNCKGCDSILYLPEGHPSAR